MPGMNSGLNVDDPTVVAAFRAALLHQGLIILAIFAVLSVAWVAVRRPPARGGSGPAPRCPSRPGGGCCGSGSGCCGWSTGCFRRSRGWPRACRRR